jgi:hypothetical protein
MWRDPIGGAWLGMRLALPPLVNFTGRYLSLTPSTIEKSWLALLIKILFQSS